MLNNFYITQLIFQNYRHQSIMRWMYLKKEVNSFRSIHLYNRRHRSTFLGRKVKKIKTITPFLFSNETKYSDWWYYLVFCILLDSVSSIHNWNPSIISIYNKSNSSSPLSTLATNSPSNNILRSLRCGLCSDRTAANFPILPQTVGPLSPPIRMSPFNIRTVFPGVACQPCHHRSS